MRDLENTGEAQRRTALIHAESRAVALFNEIEATGIIFAGRSEREAEEAIAELAFTKFGVEKHWHKRIVRAGTNTLSTALDNPPVRTIEENDTVYVDLGPVFAEWEADVGRTYALGSNAAKKQLVADLPKVFERVQQHFHAAPDMTGAALYAFAQQAAMDAGWVFGGVIAGHIVSEFPHMLLPGDKDLNRISPKNPTPLRSRDSLGRAKHWILEIHLIDAARTFGGFYERLL